MIRAINSKPMTSRVVEELDVVEGVAIAFFHTITRSGPSFVVG